MQVDSMVVGTSKLLFTLPGVSSLKGKRKIVRRLVDRLRSRHQAAIAEVGALDAHQRTEIGIAVVSNDASHAQSMVDTIAKAAEFASDAVLMARENELVHIGEALDSWEPWNDG